MQTPYRCFIRRFILDWAHTIPERIPGQKAAVIARRINHESILIRVKEADHNGVPHYSARVLTHSTDWMIVSVLRLYPYMPVGGPLPADMCWRASQLGDAVEDFMFLPLAPETRDTENGSIVGGILPRRTPARREVYEFIFNTSAGRNFAGVEHQRDGTPMPPHVSSFHSMEMVPGDVEPMTVDIQYHHRLPPLPAADRAVIVQNLSEE